MTLRNPNTNESVEDYDKLQTAEINANTTKIDDNTTKIGSDTLVGSILYRLGIIKDYVIEIGSNANGNYEKWASGKLVQWGFMVWRLDNKVLTFPIPFIDKGYTAFTQMDAVQEFDRSTSIQRTSSSTMTVYIFNGPTQMGVHYQVIGRWKA